MSVVTKRQSLLVLRSCPVIIKDVNDEEMLALALIENLQRSDLNPVEEAKAIASLSMPAV